MCFIFFITIIISLLNPISDIDIDKSEAISFILRNSYYPDELIYFKKNCLIPGIFFSKNDIYKISNDDYCYKMPYDISCIKYSWLYVNKCLNLLLYPNYIEFDKLNKNTEKLAIHYENIEGNLNKIIELKQLKELVLSGKGVQNVDFIKDLPNLEKLYLLNTNITDLEYFTINSNISVFVTGKQYYNLKFKELYKDYKNIEILNPYSNTPSLTPFSNFRNKEHFTNKTEENNNIYNNNKLNSLLNKRIINFVGGYCYSNPFDNRYIIPQKEDSYNYSFPFNDIAEALTSHDITILSVRDIIEIIKFENFDINYTYNKNTSTTLDIVIDKIENAILDNDDFMLKIEKEEIILFLRQKGALKFDELNKYKNHSTITGMYNLLVLYSGLKRGAIILTVFPSGNFNKDKCFGVKTEQNMMICY